MRMKDKGFSLLKVRIPCCFLGWIWLVAEVRADGGRITHFLVMCQPAPVCVGDVMGKTVRKYNMFKITHQFIGVYVMLRYNMAKNVDRGNCFVIM
ncbi:MAG: hypothetical protein VR69_07075 [Peptococcaceae bacterium BRH_c4b]|nr:MAG: hypothetical protein VR69_07075 [Peptococcaceae bacterium BRH_c4b]